MHPEEYLQKYKYILPGYFSSLYQNLLRQKQTQTGLVGSNITVYVNLVLLKYCASIILYNISVVDKRVVINLDESLLLLDLFGIILLNFIIRNFWVANNRNGLSN